MTESNKTQLKEVTIAEWLEHLEFSISTGKVPFIWGPPGVGKTVSTETFCKEKGWGFIDFMLPMMDNIDVSGTPEQVARKVFDEYGEYVEGEMQSRTDFAPPVAIPLEGDYVEEEYVIIFLDELPNASPMTVNACFKLIDEGKLGTRRLHPKVRFVCAGNPVRTSRAANELAEPLKNRVQHYTVKSNADGWVKYASTSNIHPAIISYIEMDKGAINYMTQSPEAIRKSLAECAFNTERSWARLSKSLYAMEAQGKSFGFISTECAAAVGEGQALAFTEFYKNNQGVPKPQDICAGKAKDAELDIGQRYFVMNCVISHLKSIKDEVQAKIDKGEATGQYYQQAPYYKACQGIYEYFDKNLSAEESAVFLWRMIATNSMLPDFKGHNSDMKSWVGKEGNLREYYDVLQK